MTSEREARDLLARQYDRDDPTMAKKIREGTCRNEEANRAIPAIIAALTRREAQPLSMSMFATRADFDAAQAKQEAQGAVACHYSVRVSEGGWTGSYAEWLKRRGATTPPAPVDVRLRASLYQHFQSIRYNADNGSQDRSLHKRLHLISQKATEAINEIERAILDGQPAGVVIDDAMVERACAVYDTYMRDVHGSGNEADSYGMRAALQAALGGGGGRGES